MWLITKIGFFSVVRDRDHSDRMIVRARHPDDIEALVDQYIPGTEITETPDSDYRYRIFIDRDIWIKLAAELAEDVNYSNFKNHVAATQGYDRAELYHDVWEILYSLQPIEISK